MVGAIALLLIVGLVRLVGALFGDDRPAVQSATDPSTESPATTIAAGLGGGGGGGDALAGAADDNATAATASGDGAPAEPPATAGAPASTAAATTTTSAPPSSGPPTAENPAKVLVVGDSDAGTFGPYLKILLDETGIAETTVDYKVSSGLSRPDFFDWPAHLQAVLPVVQPDIVVVTFGGNDAQGISVASGEFIIGDPVANKEEWTEEYTRRAGAVMDLLLEGGRSVIWVGIPNDDNPEVTERMAVQDQAARAAAAARPDVVFVDTWARFSGRSGGWAEYVVDPRDGQGKDVRASDGFHLNEVGAEILALDIAEVVKADLRARGADI